MRIARAAAMATAALFAVAPPGSAQADPLALLFETPHLETIETGRTVAYAHRRVAPRAAPEETRILLAKRGPAASTLTLDAEGAARTVAFDDLPGNPLVMVLLERAMRATAEGAGGSPFYLRGRIRAALRDGLEEVDGALVVRPFAEDPNRARLGAFADLTLRFEVDESSPGMLRSLSARTPDGAYVEEIRLDP